MPYPPDQDEVSTEPMGSRFIFLDGEPRVFTNRVQKVNGTHRGYRLIFDTEGVSDVLREREWKRLLMHRRIRPMPIDPVTEMLSDCIGSVPDEYDDKQPLTPQDALNRALAHLQHRSENEGAYQQAEAAEVVAS